MMTKKKVNLYIASMRKMKKSAFILHTRSLGVFRNHSITIATVFAHNSKDSFYVYNVSKY